MKSSARSLPAVLLVACILLVLQSGCTSPRGPVAGSHAGAPASGAMVGRETRETPTADATSVDPIASSTATVSVAPSSPSIAAPTRPTEIPAALAVIDRLATQLLIQTESIEVLAVEPAEWPDGCLGLPAEGEICSMELVPGYAVQVRVGIDAYAFRTDATGERVRLASAPPAHTGDPLVTWRDAQSFNMMIVGTQRVAIGRRGRPLIASPLAVPARATELQAFLAHFGPFQARTPAGEIALRGVGSVRPTATEQRMIAEWARVVSLEARAGREQLDAAVALRWVLRQGSGDHRDVIEVSRTGTASARSVRDSRGISIATIALDPGELEALYGWLDRFEAFDLASDSDGEKPGVTLEFRGTGVDESTPADHQALLAWIETIALHLRTRALAGG